MMLMEPLMVLEKHVVAVEFMLTMEVNFAAKITAQCTIIPKSIDLTVTMIEVSSTKLQQLNRQHLRQSLQRQPHRQRHQLQRQHKQRQMNYNEVDRARNYIRKNLRNLNMIAMPI